MPAPTLLPDDQKQDKLNPGERHADALADLAGAEKRGNINMDDFERSLKNDTADSSAEDANIGRAADKLREKESEGDVPAGGWGVNRSNNTQSVKIPWYKKKSSWFGIGGGGAGIAALLFGGALMPSFLLPNLMQNGVAKNDTRSSILEQRLLQKLATVGNGSGCSDLKLKQCRMGKMPKSFLSALERKGIKPLGVDYSGNGYVDTNPTSYEIDDGKGGKRTILAADLTSEYKKNPVFRKGVKGAKNMLFFGYNGRYMAKNFFHKFGFKRNGGLAADTDLKKNNIGDKVNERMTPKDGVKGEGAKGKFAERIEKLLRRVGMKVGNTGGDPILAIGVTACTAIAMPRFIAGTFRAIQAVQLGILLSDLILSPAGAQSAGEIKPEALDAIGSSLTEKVDGKSALDSAILMSAIGVNSNRIGVSTKYAPGFFLLSNPAIQATGTIDTATREACDLVSTPQAALASSGIWAAASAASGGIAAAIRASLWAVTKVAVGLGAITAIIHFATESGFIENIASFAYDTIAPFIGNYVTGAKGVELGDALGTAMLTFFPMASLAGGSAVLTTNQVAGFSESMQQLADERREEDIATLSPFDTSSQYTFMGSIVSNLSLYSVPGNPLQSAFSMIGSVINSPFSILTNKVSAADSAVSNCGHAKEFGINEEIAINAAGYPCTGIPSQYLGMSTTEVYNLVAGEVNAETGQPKDDSNIMMMMADCSEGDLESVTGCTIKGANTTSTESDEVCYKEDGEQTCLEARSGTIPGVDEKTRAAQSLYLYDMQVEDILSGEDNEVGYEDNSSNALAFYDQTTDIDYSQLAEAHTNTTTQTETASFFLDIFSKAAKKIKTFSEGFAALLSPQSSLPNGLLAKIALFSPARPYIAIGGGK